MTFRKLMLLTVALGFAACGPGDVGDECNDDDDCAEGLECHLHEHDGEIADHGECEEHDEDHDTDAGTDEDHSDH